MTRELDVLPQADYRRIVVAIESLANEPRPAGVVHLESDIHRIRVGRYRIIYQIDDAARTVILGVSAAAMKGRTEESENYFRLT